MFNPKCTIEDVTPTMSSKIVENFETMLVICDSKWKRY